MSIPFAAHDLDRPAVTRFAPSPNGRLHLGHAFSALMAHDVAAMTPNGRYLVRIEDIDAARSRQDHIDAIERDLAWLGLEGDGAALFQSQRVGAYRDALDRLIDEALVYRCFCSRSDIADALRYSSVRHGPDGPVYPGTCRALSEADALALADTGKPFAWRLDMAAALCRAGSVAWHELGKGTIDADLMAFGDVVLWRKDAPASYHLAATLDDAFQNIDPVVRGQDLFSYTAIHRLLQILFDLPQPSYWHHPLLLGSDGEKLSKSTRSPALALLREAGAAPGEVIAALRRGQLPSGISVSEA